MQPKFYLKLLKYLIKSHINFIGIPISACYYSTFTYCNNVLHMSSSFINESSIDGLDSIKHE